MDEKLEYGLTMENLEICFGVAEDVGAKYIGVSVYKEGFPKFELIINPIENAELQLEWYKNVYDFELKHRYSNEKIRIVGFTFGNSLVDIESDLIGEVREEYYDNTEGFDK